MYSVPYYSARALRNVVRLRCDPSSSLVNCRTGLVAQSDIRANQEACIQPANIHILSRRPVTKQPDAGRHPGSVGVPGISSGIKTSTQPMDSFKCRRRALLFAHSTLLFRMYMRRPTHVTLSTISSLADPTTWSFKSLQPTSRIKKPTRMTTEAGPSMRRRPP